MKYNTFWGYVFWTLLLLSTLGELRPVLMNMWSLLYDGTIGDIHWVFWVPAQMFLVALVTLKIILLRWFFPRNSSELSCLISTKDICGICAGMSTFFSLVILTAILVSGGLKTFQTWQAIQAMTVLLTPFIFIYYLFKEE